MLERADFAHRLPHQGPMALIDKVLVFDADEIQAQAAAPDALNHPLRRDGTVAAVHLCEYGAQAMAVHGALLAQSAGGRARPGLLVALRAVDLLVDRIDGLAAPLDIVARREHTDDQVWRYHFDIHSEGRLLARGQAMVMLEPEDTR
ncbi:MAG: phosphotransferase [Xanthomonadales bacterium]|nr:phosphotransferase [Xanthomonadales bacterium]